VRNKYLYITLLSILAWHAEAQGQQRDRQVPRLVVNITIDQLRSDLLEIFDPSFSEEGFRKLLTEGLVFENASCQYRDIDAMSAISSVITGTSPFYHSITGAQWIDRQTLRPVVASPEHLSASTIGDELKMATDGAGKVFAVAPEKAIAQLSAGHAPDGTTWNEHPKKPWTPADITGKALEYISDKALGQDTIPDLLMLTYDAGNKDKLTYSMLDDAIAKLIRQTEQQVGKGRTLYVLSSTGYSEESIADYKRYNIPSGTFYINRTANLLNMYFGGLWGAGKYVESYFKNQLYINRQLIENKRVTIQDALQIAKEFLLQSAGVMEVETHLYENHRGDLTIHLAPGWQIENEDSHEQLPVKSPLAYFPIIVYGINIKSERVLTPVTIDRIAPSISKAIRIRAPNACHSAPLF